MPSGVDVAVATIRCAPHGRWKMILREKAEDIRSKAEQGPPGVCNLWWCLSGVRWEGMEGEESGVAATAAVLLLLLPNWMWPFRLPQGGCRSKVSMRPAAAGCEPHALPPRGESRRWGVLCSPVSRGGQVWPVFGCCCFLSLGCGLIEWPFTEGGGGAENVLI